MYHVVKSIVYLYKPLSTHHWIAYRIVVEHLLYGNQLRCSMLQ